MCDRTVTEHILFDSTTGANHLKKIVQHMKLLGHSHTHTNTHAHTTHTSLHCLYRFWILFGVTAPTPQWARVSSFTRFLDHTQGRTTVGRTPLNEWSARRRDLYLTTHDNHNKHPCPRWVRSHNPSKRVAADLRFRPSGHWDRRRIYLPYLNNMRLLIFEINLNYN
jgi:hypothetical protein